MIRILIADDHAIVRQGLRQLLAASSDFQVLGEATNGHEVLARLRELPCDVVVLDLSMPGRSGIDLIKQIKLEHPKLRILVFTMHEEQQYAVRTIKAGASGYLTKESASDLLPAAIRKIASGGAYITPAVAEQLALDVMPHSSAAPHLALSDREFQVMRMLVAGTSVTAIAEELHLSVKTISTHKARLMQKLGLASQADLVRYAMSHDLGVDS
ncbi:MAG: response regulator [Burkholderiales bacterium]